MGSEIKLLLIDDEKDFIQEWQTLLLIHKYEIYVAKSAYEALAILDQKPLDINIVH